MFYNSQSKNNKSICNRYKLNWVHNIKTKIKWIVWKSMKQVGKLLSKYTNFPMYIDFIIRLHNRMWL